MRTPIRLDDALLRRAKAAAAASGQSLNDLIVAAVRAAIEPRRSAPRAMDVPTFKGRGLRPNVDLDNSAALLDLMDRRLFHLDAKAYKQFAAELDKAPADNPRLRRLLRRRPRP
jgi:uncharacterized protein (DUF1778 family)